MRSALLALAAVCLTAGCSGAPSTAGSGGAPSTSSTARPEQGDRSSDELRSMLLQSQDLPTMADRRDAAITELTTQATPQLALCTEGRTVGPHQLANVLAKPPKPGQAQVFELLSSFATAADARQSFDVAVAAAQRCGSYVVAERPYRVVDVRRPRLAGTEAALQYRLTTPDVISGDVRTLALSGRSVVLLTGFGAPPAGQTLLEYQASVMVKALHRLRP